MKIHNYTVYHLHSDISNGTTNIDSVTKFNTYVEQAAALGMQSLGFSEHGNIYKWYSKKMAIEAAGMKYLHGVELYITMQEDAKVRDNYHCIAIARNYAGFLELNRLASAAFNRADNHFYYAPRVYMRELEATSDNLLITSACLGGALSSSAPEADHHRFLQFLLANRHRCFLEVQHHMDFEQVEHNRQLVKLSKQYGLPLIAGTDTHALNDTHMAGRAMLQISKKVKFATEDQWDMTFKTYEELCAAYEKQGVLTQPEWLQAIENTNVLAEMVEPFDLDTSNKYPHVFDQPVQRFRRLVYEAAEAHPYALARHGREKLYQRIEEELAAYEAVSATPYMLLKEHLTRWERAHGIYMGVGRGSVTGSMIAYLLHITEMDSMLFDLNFFRFINPSRVSLADIDSDYAPEDRDRVKSYILDEKMNLPGIVTSEVITFNTIATKGSIHDIARAFNTRSEQGIDTLHYSNEDIKQLCGAVDRDGQVPLEVREAHAELFRYVEIVTGTIVSIGSHPAGVLTTDRDLAAEVGLCSTSGSQYPVSFLDKYELEALNWVKWDVLGLDNVALINQTCKLAEIDLITPDTIDLEDMRVWNEIRNDTTCIFQFESGQASNYLRRFFSDETILKAKARNPNFSMIKWLSFANGLLRPACASYRDDVAKGNAYDNGLPALNDFLAQEMGHVCMQETIMKWLVQFCGYTQAESDTVRRGIAKKKGVDQLLPQIESRFIAYAPQHYNISPADAAQVIKPFIQTIMDASDYAFSWNHSDAYSCIGYMCGYLRTYYPMAFVAAALNVFAEDQEKTGRIVEYAQQHGIHLSPPRYGYSRATYAIDRKHNTIYKGIASIKYLNAQVAEALYAIAQCQPRQQFMEVLQDITATPLDSRQLDILIKLDFFSAYGNPNHLAAVRWYFDFFKQGSAKQIAKEKIAGTPMAAFIVHYASDTGTNGKERKSFVVQDMPGLLLACESYTRTLNLPDDDFRTKCAYQTDYLGYIDLTTNKEEDRRKLLITDLYPLRSKESRDIWGYALFTRSIGSGKVSRLTLQAHLFHREPVNKGDILLAKRVHKNKTGYWYLDDYEGIV